MALLDRLPTTRTERPSVRERFAKLPGLRGLLVQEVEAPAINVLEELAITIQHADNESMEDTLEMVLELDAVAERVKLEIEAEGSITRRQDASLNQVWAAAHAWDASRTDIARNEPTEHVEELMELVMNRTSALAASQALKAAYERSKLSGQTFDTELDNFNTELQNQAKELPIAA